MKTIELVEDVHVQLLPDKAGAMEPNAYVGQRFKLDGKLVEIVSNSYLTWTVRYVTLWERLWEKFRVYF